MPDYFAILLFSHAIIYAAITPAIIFAISIIEFSLPLSMSRHCRFRPALCWQRYSGREVL